MSDAQENGVKRWTPDFDYDRSVTFMSEDSFGEYVKHSDHLAEMQKKDEAHGGAIRQHLARLENQAFLIAGQRDTIEQHEKTIAELKRVNAKLKEQRNLWIKSQSLTPENRIKEANAELAALTKQPEPKEGV